MSHECPDVRAGAFECLSNVPGWRQRYSNVSRMPRGQWGGTRISFECPSVWGGALECHLNAPGLRGGHSNVIQISFKYHLNIIQISFKYHPNIIQISFKYHSNIPASGGGHSSVTRMPQGQGWGHSSVTRISLSQEVKCHSSAPGSGWGVRMPEGRGEWVSFECPRVGTRPRLAQIRTGPRQDQPSLSQSALSQSALGCPARPSLTQPDSGPHQGRAQFQLAWPLPGSAQLGSAQLNYHAKQTS